MSRRQSIHPRGVKPQDPAATGLNYLDIQTKRRELFRQTPLVGPVIASTPLPCHKPSTQLQNTKSLNDVSSILVPDPTLGGGQMTTLIPSGQLSDSTLMVLQSAALRATLLRTENENENHLIENEAICQVVAIWRENQAISKRTQQRRELALSIKTMQTVIAVLETLDKLADVALAATNDMHEIVDRLFELIANGNANVYICGVSEEAKTAIKLLRQNVIPLTQIKKSSWQVLELFEDSRQLAASFTGLGHEFAAVGELVGVITERMAGIKELEDKVAALSKLVAEESSTL